MANLIFFSNWVEDNSGQIQIAIGLLAFGVAVVALCKILNQIKISITQTKLTIDQIDRLNKERLFDLRLRLITSMSEHLKTLRNLQDENNNLSSKLHVFLIEIENNYKESLEALQSMAQLYRERIEENWKLIKIKNQETNQLQKSLDENKDISSIESIIVKIEKDQIEFNLMRKSINDLDKNIKELWLPLKHGDVMQAAKIKYGLN